MTFTLFSNELCDVQTIINYSTQAYCCLTLSASDIAGSRGCMIVKLTTLQTFGPLCSTFAAVVTYVQSN